MIFVNEVYKYVEGKNKDALIRIITISQDKNIFYYVNLHTQFSMPSIYDMNSFLDEIEQGIVLRVPDPYIKRIEESELSVKTREKRDSDWKLISYYWENEKVSLLTKSQRGKVFETIEEQYKVSKSSVKRMFTRFWQRGMNKNALLPDYMNSGGKGKDKILSEHKVGRPKNADYEGNRSTGINITSEIKALFQNGIERYYQTKKQTSLTEVYTSIVKDFFSERYMEDGEMKYKVWDKERVPTYRQFYYWFKKMDEPTKSIIERQGRKAYELKYRPILGNSINETIGPGTRFQVDATIADIYLVSRLDRNRIIGRPIVYVIIDVFSRLVTGIYVGLEGPSWIGAMMALDNMVTDKVAFCKQYGIEIEEDQWPAKHLPEVILADRGEFEGYSVENLINNLGIAIENTPPYRGDLKGIVERSFRTLNTKLKHKTPGAIMKEFRQRGDRDYRLDATLTLEEFTKIYIQLVLHHNNTLIAKYPVEKEMLIDSVVPIPVELWKWGIENKKGSLRSIDGELMRLNVLPKGKAVVSRAGIKFKGLMYGSQKAIQEQWFLKQATKNIEVVYDPRNLSNIYILDEDGRSYETCYLLEGSQQYKDVILEELIFMQELRSELREKQKQTQLQNDVNLEKEIEAIVSKAKKEKGSTPKLYDQSKTKKLKSIKRNREVEKELNKLEEVFVVKEVTLKQPGKVVEILQEQESEIVSKNEEPTAKQKLMNKLKQKRDESRGKG